eukprot:CAMPEP_0119558564 /NCGR_PEP_ID=MMETSP1352-20130426/10864_1 /TAXON_ID=265584 /ORGANISM="Stauroneis constricta, Strain CCMP1120" /LENGTH=707 /DNA_ID=CAMNT_0007605953 /DNA_START=158 /DNA_END=2281 /DNA_ORIENTATION=+
MKRKIVNGVSNGANGAGGLLSGSNFVPDEFVQACFCNAFGGCIDGNERKNIRGQTFWQTGNDNDAMVTGIGSDEALSNQASAERADAALVQELNQLSVHERQNVYEDVHGISDRCEKETPELIRSSMQAVDAELKKVPTTDDRKKIYGKALFLRPNYFKSTYFLLPFLRKNEFDAKKTAQCVLDHLSFRHLVVGLDGLVATYLRYEEDLTEGAKIYIRTGRLQLLPQPDRSGRPILVVFPKQQAPDYDYMDGILVYWWFFDVMRRLYDNTPKGIVMVMYDSGIRFKSIQQQQLTKKYYFNMDGLKAATQFLSTAAIYFSAIHFCYDTAKMATPMATFQAVIGKNARVRFRSHCASPTECLYTLMTFGINTNHFPVDQDGNVLVERHLGWLEQRRGIEKEDAKQLTKTIQLTGKEMVAIKSRKSKKQPADQLTDVTLLQYPYSASVVLGRGFHEHQHPGNQKLAEIVDGYWEPYQTCTWKEKMDMTIQIVEQIKAGGGRFMQKYVPKNEDEAAFVWIEVDDSKAREKVSHAFRNNTVQRKDAKGKDKEKSTIVKENKQTTTAAVNSDKHHPVVVNTEPSNPSSPQTTTGRVTPSIHQPNFVPQSPMIQSSSNHNEQQRQPQPQQQQQQPQMTNMPDIFIVPKEVSPPSTPLHQSTNQMLLSSIDENNLKLFESSSFALNSMDHIMNNQTTIISIQDFDNLDILNDDFS